MNQQNGVDDTQDLMNQSSDQAQEGTSLLAQLPEIQKDFTIKGKQYTYKGPDHEYVQQLLMILDDKQRRKSKYAIVEDTVTFVESVEDWFVRKCTFCEMFTLDVYFFIIATCFLIIYLVFSIQSVNLYSYTSIEKTTWKSDLVYWFPLDGLYFTVLAILYIKVENYLLIVIIFLLCGFLPGILAYALYNPTTDLTQFVQSLIFCVAYLHALFVNSFYLWLKQLFKNIVAAIVIVGWCLFIPYLIGFTCLGYFLTASSINYQDSVSFLTSTLYVPLIIILLASWVLLKARVIDLPPKVIISALERIKYKLVNKFMESQENTMTNDFLSRNSNIISASFIGILYLILEIWLFVELGESVTNSNTKYVITYAFLVMAIPIFLIFGVFVSVSNRGTQYTFLFIPLIFGTLFIFWSTSLQYLLGDYSNYDPISGILDYAPLITLLIWLTLSLFGIDKRKLQLYIMTYLCYCIAFPVVLLTLYSLTEQNIYQYSSYALLLVGLLGITGLFLYYVYKSIKTTIRVREIAISTFPDFGEFKYYYLTEYAFWVNAVFFLVSYYIVCQIYWDMQDGQLTDATQSEKGTIYALLGIHPVLFVLINIALAQPSLEIDEQSLHDEISQRLAQRQNIRLEQLRKYQNYATIIGMAGPFIVRLIFALASSSEFNSTIAYAMTFGLPLAFGVFKLFVMVKNQSATYQNFFQPFATSLSWCCVFFPFGVIVPALAVYFNNLTDNYKIFAQVTVAAGILICIFGVTGVAIFFQILLNREQFEKKKRSILEQVIEEFASLAVLCDLTSGSLLYIKFLKVQRDVYQRVLRREITKKEFNKEVKLVILNQLLLQDPIYYLPFNGPQLNYDQYVVSGNMYLNYQKAKQETSLKQQENSKCKQLLLDIIYCRCGLEEIEQLEESKQKEILSLQAIIDVIPEVTVNQIMPHYSDIYKIAAGNDAGMNPEHKLLKNKQPFKSIDTISTQKTQQLAQCEVKQINEKDLNRLKQSEFYQALSSDKYIPLFMHEVFMEFANQEQDLPLSISFLDFQHFARLTNLKIELQQYQRFASQPWLNQTLTLTEADFAKLIKNLYAQDFDELRDLIKNNIYPQLIVSIKSLLSNLKYQNRQLLQNSYDYDSLPFSQSSFDNIQKPGKKQFRVESDINTKTDQMQSEIQVKKTQKQLIYEQQVQLKEIEEKYEKEKQGSKFCCYRFGRFMNKICCEWPREFFGSQQPVIKPKRMEVFSKRQHMGDWKNVCDRVVERMISASDEYDKMIQQVQDSFSLRINFSNVLALMFRFQDLYSLAALAFNPVVDWFGTGSTQNGASIVDGSILSADYFIFYYLACGIAVTYGVLGKFAATRVQNNTFGQDNNGNIARFPHPQFFLSTFISILSGQFLLVMKNFIDITVCNYETNPYSLVRDSTFECFTTQHFMFIGIALLLLAIYYPLSTFFQPTFQYMDHSLDLKYKSTYVVLYIQCKLLILGLSTLFSNISDFFEYQMLFSSFIMIFLLLLHMRMKPCYVHWFNFFEQLGFLGVLAIYIGAFIIMMTGERIIGIVFTSCMSGICLILAGVTLYREANKGTKTKPQLDYQDDVEVKIYEPKVQMKLRDRLYLQDQDAVTKIRKVKPINNDPIIIQIPGQRHNDLNHTLIRIDANEINIPQGLQDSTVAQKTQ